MEYIPDFGNFQQLLTAPPGEEVGQKLLQWARHTKNNIERGDMMLGILSVAEAQQVPVAFRQAALCGISEAWMELASWLTQPPFGPPDFAAAEQALRQAITLKVPKAKHKLVELVWYFLRDEATEEQKTDACQYLRELVGENDQDDHALFMLGQIINAGFGTQADPSKAFEFQTKAANLGNSNAWFELYVHYSAGMGVPKDEKAGFEANRKAAEAGHYRAMYNMGAFLATGRFGEKDMAKAVEWYEKSSDAGNPNATITLAIMYATGDGVEPDLEYAVELFDMAEDMGADTTEYRESVGLSSDE
ncbi:MAG: sel1 repeat family protein [Blastocatellia bacterium]|nr:sel1 repeat family protein [Blastocatellia bacterium]